MKKKVIVTSYARNKNLKYVIKTKTRPKKGSAIASQLSTKMKPIGKPHLFLTVKPITLLLGFNNL